MVDAIKSNVAWLVLGLSLSLSFMGILRLASVQPNALTALSGYATPGYVMTTVMFTVLLVRAGLPLKGFGFTPRPDLRQLGLALGAIAVLRGVDSALDPLIESLLGARDFGRFAAVEGSRASLVALLVHSWTLAAFGEEFAYRIVLLRGLSFAFGDSRRGQIAALALQALLFGLVHAYQGPAGIAGSTISGLVFGAVTIAGRWSIWPAALAHGVNNTIGIVALYRGA